MTISSHDNINFVRLAINLHRRARLGLDVLVDLDASLDDRSKLLGSIQEDAMQVRTLSIVERGFGEGIGDGWILDGGRLLDDEKAIVFADGEAIGEGTVLGELVVNAPAFDKSTRVGEKADVVAKSLELFRLFQDGHAARVSNVSYGTRTTEAVNTYS